MSKKGVFASRSRAFQAAVGEKLEHLNKTRLACACALLDPIEEKKPAEVGVNFDLSEWPEY